MTEVSIPGAPLGHDTDAIPRLTATTHDFTWPGGGNISTQLEDDVPFCVKTARFYSWGFLRNVTNAFTEDDASSTSCVPAFGEAFVNAILEDDCNATRGNPVDWDDLQACRGSVQSPGTRFTRVIHDHADLNKPLSNNVSLDKFKWEYVSGEQFMYSRTWVYDPEAEDAARAFQNESRALQVVLLQTEAQTGEGREKTSQLLCTRVDTGEYEGGGVVLGVSMGAVVVAVVSAMALVM